MFKYLEMKDRRPCFKRLKSYKFISDFDKGTRLGLKM